MFDLTNMPPFARGLILLLVFLLVLVVVLTVTGPALTRAAVRRRIDERLAPSTGSGGGATLRSEETGRAWIRLVNIIEKRGLSLADTNDAKLRARLIAAGYAHPIAPRVFTLTRLVLTLGLPVAFVLISYG